MNEKSQAQLKPAPAKNFIGSLVGQGLGCSGACLFAQIGALLLSAILYGGLSLRLSRLVKSSINPQ